MSYPRRIVCLTEETTETLYLLGEGDRVVGISGYTVRPPEARGLHQRRLTHGARISCAGFAPGFGTNFWVRPYWLSPP